MREIILTNQTKEGIPLQAVFDPKQGMNLVRYRWGDCEIIDQSTSPLFLERFAGLGSLIGPHFHHRNLQDIPPVPFENLFPHIAKVKAKGVIEPFSHGIARYAPWQYKATQTTISARLSSTDLWHGIILSSLEGFDFEMYFDVQLLPEGLVLELGVESDRPSVVGLHYYYSLQDGPAHVAAKVQKHYRQGNQWRAIPNAWLQNGMLLFDASLTADYGFQPQMEEARIALQTAKYILEVSYQADTDDHSFQLYRPEGASYICIEPLSSKNPQKPNRKSAKLLIRLEVQSL